MSAIPSRLSSVPLDLVQDGRSAGALVFSSRNANMAFEVCCKAICDFVNRITDLEFENLEAGTADESSLQRWRQLISGLGGTMLARANAYVAYARDHPRDASQLRAVESWLIIMRTCDKLRQNAEVIAQHRNASVISAKDIEGAWDALLEWLAPLPCRGFLLGRPDDHEDDDGNEKNLMSGGQDALPSTGSATASTTEDDLYSPGEDSECASNDTEDGTNQDLASEGSDWSDEEGFEGCWSSDVEGVGSPERMHENISANPRVEGTTPPLPMEDTAERNAPSRDAHPPTPDQNTKARASLGALRPAPATIKNSGSTSREQGEAYRGRKRCPSPTRSGRQPLNTLVNFEERSEPDTNGLGGTSKKPRRVPSTTGSADTGQG